VLRGDISRLERCVAITTGENGVLPRCKPFKYTYEKEIVLYAHYKQLDYFSTECIYSPMAYRGFAREFLKDLEAVKSTSIIDIIRSAEHFAVDREQQTFKEQVLQKCTRCGYMSSQEVCKACILLEGLNKGDPTAGVGRTKKGAPKKKKDPIQVQYEDSDKVEVKTQSIPNNVHKDSDF
jgi:cytoplasmic tRNA 2-thiolation protein 1